MSLDCKKNNYVVVDMSSFKKQMGAHREEMFSIRNSN